MSKAAVSPSAASTLTPSPTPPVSLFASAAVNSRRVALVFRGLALAVIVTGVIRHADLLTGRPDWTTFLFYTMVSNLLCLAWMLLLTVRTARDVRRIGPSGTSSPSPRVSGAVMMAITVTMLIYLVVLVPTRFADGDTDVFSLTDNLIHIVTPILMIADWLLFVPKGSFRWTDPLLWMLIPYAYLTWAFSYGALGGEFYPGQTYPYPFMDVDALGPLGVAQWVVALSVALIVVGLLFVAVDRALGALARRSAEPGL
ncbi:Pr6Pr family membrane protein [uncultured Microbacterium sp.]|uniref:Pr6Pr family membrane protein n=1 Tax=uncultured Microbacterium sp. TaxID=191216 RepID=UPI0028D1D976|nr:Pr6Pr family membrane protein [uncultured Microbacterium sp.]